MVILSDFKKGWVWQMKAKMDEFLEAVADGDLEQVFVRHLRNHPVLHFSDHAEKIMTEGFRRGEPNVSMLDCTYDQGEIREHKQPGFNFAFNVTTWDIENDGFDYEICSSNNGRSLQGMYSDTAIIFPVDGAYTHHYDEFSQVVFWGPSADTGKAILLRNVGHFIEDGEAACDEDGNEVICWTATDYDGRSIVKIEDMLTLRECVLDCLLYLKRSNRLSKEVWAEVQESYEAELSKTNLRFETRHRNEEESPSL